MNREEAARILHPDTRDVEFEKDVTHWGERLDKATEMGIEALRGPQPDPITGLVPCGCGGKARLRGNGSNGPYWWVSCGNCDIATDGSGEREDVESTWNRAMGYKGGAE